MAQFITQIPWWITIFLILAGGVTIFYGNQQFNPRVRSTGLITVSLAILLGAVRFLIDTPAEQAERRTRQIVDACDKKDWPRMASLIDADTRLELSGHEKELSVTDPNVKGADQITKDAQIAAQADKLKSVFIASMRTQEIEGLISVTFNAYTLQEATMDRPFPSSWEFDFFPVGNRWDLRQIKLTALGSE